MSETKGTLSIVATPIGNLEDITLRALRVLTEADAIYAEDTRVIGKLLAHYKITTSVHRLDAATETKKADEIIERLEEGEKVAYVSDAGTPGISDPGSRLVAYVRNASPENTIEAIPGASALTATLSIAGIASDSFTFLGFLPHKKGRQTALRKIGESEHPVVVYESPHRIIKLLNELSKLETAVTVTVAREITKMFEEVLVGDPLVVAKNLEDKGGVRGEFVVVIEPK
jgi:16S rRNA (cytidine1402-2'-O)-methyltransferase